MNLCDDKHEEICFEGRDCPMCILINEKDNEIRDLQKEIKELEEVI